MPPKINGIPGSAGTIAPTRPAAIRAAAMTYNTVSIRNATVPPWLDAINEINLKSNSGASRGLAVEKLIGIAVALILVAGPLLLGLTGLIGARHPPADAAVDRAMPWNWKLTVASALLYTLAFNLTFFIQEL